MSGDGFAVKTTLSQIGNVARSQLKGQGQNSVHNLEKQMEQTDKRTEKVKETEETLKSRIDPDAKKDRKQKDQETAKPGDEDRSQESKSEDALEKSTDGLGLMVDLKA